MINQSIQGLRGLSIFLVFVSHWYAGLSSAGLLAPDLKGSFIEIFNVGKYGVEIFFMISGFVIVKSLRRHANLDLFVVDRVARIYPLFLCLHLAVFTAGPLVGYKFFSGMDAVDWLYLFIVNLLLLPGVFDLPLAQPVAWSLSYEIAFYALAVAAMAFYRQSPSGLRLACWSVWGVVAGSLVWYHPRTIFFLPGVAAALWGRAPLRLPVHVRSAVPMAFLTIFLWAWPRLGLSDGRTMEDFGANPATWGYWGLGLAAGTLFFCYAALVDSSLARVLGSRVAAGFGDLSYSFYLWHTFVVVGLRPIFRIWIMPEMGPVAGFWIFGIMALLLSTAVSWWSRQLLEVRAGDWSKQWLRHRYAVSNSTTGGV